jgi:hypothetical protein
VGQQVDGLLDQGLGTVQSAVAAALEAASFPSEPGAYQQTIGAITAHNAYLSF